MTSKFSLEWSDGRESLVQRAILLRMDREVEAARARWDTRLRRRLFESSFADNISFEALVDVTDQNTVGARSHIAHPYVRWFVHKDDEVRYRASRRHHSSEHGSGDSADGGNNPLASDPIVIYQFAPTSCHGWQWSRSEWK